MNKLTVTTATVYEVNVSDSIHLRVGWRRRFLTKRSAVEAYCRHCVLVKYADREDWGWSEWDQARYDLNDHIEQVPEMYALFKRYCRFVYSCLNPTHLFPADPFVIFTACGYKPKDGWSCTEDEGRVTCKTCLRAIGARDRS